MLRKHVYIRPTRNCNPGQGILLRQAVRLLAVEGTSHRGQGQCGKLRAEEISRLAVCVLIGSAAAPCRR